MPKIIKNIMHRVLSGLGLELRLRSTLQAARLRERELAAMKPWLILQGLGISTILDVGANEGQFAVRMRSVLPGAKVYSFEPLPEVFDILKARFAHDPQVVPVRLGLSDSAGVRDMYKSDFSPSSSLLPMAGMHKQEWPNSVGNTEVKVDLARLDDWVVESGVELTPEILVKLDVQGFELAVINGGVDTLRNAKVVLVEVSFFELYEGQPLFRDIHDRLHDLGFQYRGSLEQHYSKRMDRILFADAVFINLRAEQAHDH